MGAIKVFLLIAGMFLFAMTVPAEPIVLATADTAPFSDEDGTGFYDLLLNEAFRRLGIPLEIRRFPSERALHEANTGRVDGEFGRIEQIGELYENLRLVPEPLIEWHFSAFLRPGTTHPRSFEDLREYHVGFIRGWKIYEENVRDTRSLTLAVAEDQLFHLLEAQRVDVVLYNRLRGLAWIQRNAPVSVEIVPEPLAVRPMYLFLHYRKEFLIPQISRALQDIRRDGTYDELQAEAFGFVP